MAPERTERQIPVNVPVDALRRWHLSPGAQERLTPPWPTDRRVERVQASFAQRFEAVDAERSVLIDEVQFEPRRGPLGLPMRPDTLRRALDRRVTYRLDTAKGDIEAQARAPTERPLRVLVTGSSGLVGSALVPYLQTAGHRVFRLRRGEREDLKATWRPDVGDLHLDEVLPLDAVVHLAGESIAARRWRPAQKRRILESRVQGTELLAKRLAALPNPPRVLVGASATGFYGDGGDDPLDETRPRGTGFLADVASAWEDAADPARAAGIRVVNLRFGMVLTPAGGALPKLLPAARLGLGGPIGRGRPFWPWISIDDAVSIVLHVMAHEEFEGPVNVVAPEAVRQREFARTLGRVLDRPAFLPAPPLALKLALGEMAEALLLASQRVVPARLVRADYPFRQPTLEDALRHLLGRRRA